MSYQVLSRSTGRREVRRVNLPIVPWRARWELGGIIHPDFNTYAGQDGAPILYLGNDIILGSIRTNEHVTRSADGGMSFSDVNISLYHNSAYNLKPEEFVDMGNGRILLSAFAGTACRLFTSYDYGQTWIRHSTQPSKGLAGFVYLGNGVLLASQFRDGIRKSTDYGQTWGALVEVDPDRPLDAGIVQMVRFDSGIILAVDDTTDYVSTYVTYNHVYRSNNDGASWTDILLPRDQVGFSRLLVLGEGIAVGHTWKYNPLPRTIDHGTTWAPGPTTFPDNSVSAFANLGNGIAIAFVIHDTGESYYRACTVARTKDYGATWAYLPELSFNSDREPYMKPYEVVATGPDSAVVSCSWNREARILRLFDLAY